MNGCEEVESESHGAGARGPWKVVREVRRCFGKNLMAIGGLPEAGWILWKERWARWAGFIVCGCYVKGLLCKIFFVSMG